MTKTESRHDAEADAALHEENQKLRKDNQMLRMFIADAAGYLAYAFHKGVADATILTTLAHDISGIHNKSRCFLPRVSGYAGRKVKVE